MYVKFPFFLFSIYLPLKGFGILFLLCTKIPVIRSNSASCILIGRLLFRTIDKNGLINLHLYYYKGVQNIMSISDGAVQIESA